MNTLNTRASALVALLALLPWAAEAHEGHGLPGAGHWHATDTLGLLLVAALAAGAWLLNRRK